MSKIKRIPIFRKREVRIFKNTRFFCSKHTTFALQKTNPEVRKFQIKLLVHILEKRMSEFSHKTRGPNFQKKCSISALNNDKMCKNKTISLNKRRLGPIFHKKCCQFFQKARSGCSENRGPTFQRKRRPNRSQIPPTGRENPQG